jgi:hypothetical protein
VIRDDKYYRRKTWWYQKIKYRSYTQYIYIGLYHRKELELTVFYLVVTPSGSPIVVLENTFRERFTNQITQLREHEYIFALLSHPLEYYERRLEKVQEWVIALLIHLIL